MHRSAFSAAGWILIASASCAPAPEPTPPVVTTPAAALTTEGAASAPAPSATASADAAAPQGRRHTVTVQLRRGDPPCTLVLDGDAFEDAPDYFIVTDVSRIATVEAGGGCAAAILFDLEAEKKAPPGESEPEALKAGSFQKPHRPATPDMPDGPSNVLQDVDFDGYADLCVVALTGAYNYSQRCWVFDPARRTFRRESDLDEVVFMELDPAKKRLRSSLRVGGPVYADRQYAWDKGKPVLVAEQVTTLGERPDGKPLPAGFNRWVVRSELRGGKLVKVFEGPEKDK